MKASKFLLSLADYQRIYQTIHGIAVAVGQGPAQSCLMFGIYGAYLLSRHYNLQANPAVGAAFFRVGVGDQTLAFVDQEQDLQSGSSEGFHCWVEADGWCIDFAAPLYPEMLAQAGGQQSRERRMFQKPLSAMARDPFSLSSPGDFFLQRDPALTAALLQRNLGKAAFSDLAEIACGWYAKPPRKMEATRWVTDNHGEVQQLTLRAPVVTGVW